MKKKKVIIISLVIMLLVTVVITFSYAYWRLTYQATSVNKIVSSCFSMELTNEKNNITLEDAYPISNDKGKALTPYSFTITNTCDLFASYTINLEMLEGTTLNSKYVKTMINSEAIANLNTLETTDTSIEGATESRVLFKGSLGAGDSTDYTFRLWMDYDTPLNEETISKVFQSKITVTAEVSTYSPVENGFTNLAEALLVNEYQTTSLDVAKNKIASKQEVDFSKTAPLIEWQEVRGTKISDFKITKADPSIIGSYGVTTSTTRIVLGKNYTLDTTTGYFVLGDKASYDPTTIDFTDSVYYSCGSTLGATGNNTITYWNGSSCSTMYVLTSLKNVENSTLLLSSGDEAPTKIFTFSIYKYGVAELESDMSDKGIYEETDDFGTTYYYRGNVTNNNILFAGNYWKVIRINGDGSIRLLYSGTSSNDNSIIEKSAYHNNLSDPTYLGYMYSNTLNTSYADTIKNDNDNAIKSKLDEWYKTNILDKGYSSYIADSGFCNDRSLASDSLGDGYSSIQTTYYTPRYRILGYTPTFKCPNISNDLFTSNNNSVGNGKLTYPIGLVSVDEISFAGLVNNSLNTMNYTKVPYSYWSMSPYAFSSNIAAKGYSINGDTGDISGSNVTASYAIRPVINLKADTEITGGIGTKNDPFIVK